MGLAAAYPSGIPTLALVNRKITAAPALVLISLVLVELEPWNYSLILPLSMLTISFLLTRSHASDSA